MIPTSPSLLRFALALSLASSASLAAELRPARVPLAPDRAQVRWGPAFAGAEWARGADYKAGFDASGAQFVPFLGAKAPRNFPLALHATSARCGAAAIPVRGEVEPRRAGDTVEFERGGFVERYELAPRSLEQSFVFAALPARGELVLELAIASELGAQAGPEGIAFTNELGGVRYGRATAIDAHGARCEAPVELVEGGLVLRVPAVFVEQAALPLTIDPALTAITVAPGAKDDFLPDVALEPTTSQYVAVYEEAFSATDHDVAAVLLDGNGAIVGSRMLDTTSAYWAHPRVAAQGATNTLLVVVQIGAPAAAARQVFGQRLVVSPGVIVVNTSFAISAPASGDNVDPDVGADAIGTSSVQHFGVVWRRVNAAGDGDIVFQIAVGSGTLLLANELLLGTGALDDRRPSIGCSSLGSARWDIAWERELAANDHDILAARVSTAGALVGGPLTISGGASDDTRPSVSTELVDSGHWLVAFERATGATHDIQARLMQGTTQVLLQNLTQLEERLSPGLQNDDQSEPCAESDGASFVLAYATAPAGSANTDIAWATFNLLLTDAPRLEIAEGNQRPAPSANGEHVPRIAARSNGGNLPGRFLELHHAVDLALLDDDVLGSFYDAQDFTPYCFPGEDVGACPCNNPPSSVGRGCNNSSNTGGALLVEVGTASLAADSVQFQISGEKPSATSVVLQGSSDGAAVFGQGLRCVTGSLRRLYTKNAVSGAFFVPTAFDPSPSARAAQLGDVIGAGQKRFYLVYYRDATVLGGCPATSTFNTTNSGALVWRP